MFVKKIVLTGFKSFADKTEFLFGDGITAVVGPNGCGKSNVVDAVKWVLGEQSAKGLRGRQMLDMIFNGSGTRKSAGLAQVDLVFDNADGKLSTDQTEVTVSRRLYRSGESEYLLNLQPCRLKDIKELFLDTGVGLGAYSIIEQGKVDLLLQANPQERRIVFEEAAGISKYKLRKREAARKLERTEQNLLRVQDVIDEVSRRLRSVKQQAGRARSYQTYHARLQVLRSTYSMAEYHKMRDQIARQSAEAERLADEMLSIRRDISANEAASSDLDVEIVQLDERIRDADGRVGQIEASIKAHEERVTQSRHRADEQREVLATTEQRIAGHRAEAQSAHDSIAREAAALHEIDDALAEITRRTEELSTDDRRLAHEQARAENDLEAAKSAVIETMRRQAQLNNDLAAWTSRRESLDGQRERVAARQRELADELSRQHEHARTLQRREEELHESIDRASAALEAMKQQVAAVRDALDQRARELAEAKEHRSALLSKQQMLQDLERRREGVREGVRLLLERREQSPHEHDYIVGMVADLFQTDVEHAPLIELALGERDQCLVVRDGERFLGEVRKLGEQAGRVSAFCLDRISPLIGGRDFSGQPGFVANAIDLVRYPGAPGHEILMRRLFGNVVVVASLDDAVAMSRQDASGYRFITRGGEILEPDGSVSAGLRGTQTGLVSRKSELRELGDALAAHDLRVRELEERRAQTTAEVDQLDQQTHALREELHAVQSERIEVHAQVQNLEESIRRLSNEQPLLAGELQMLDSQIRETVGRLEQGGAALAELTTTAEAEKRTVDDLGRQLADAVERRQRTAAAFTEARIEAGRLREKQSAIATTLNGLRRRLAEIDAAIEATTREADECRHRIDSAERTAVEATEKLRTLAQERDALAREAVELRRTRDGVRVRIETLAAEVKAHRSALEERESRRHAIDVELEGVRTRCDDLVARVREELDIDLPARYKDYQHSDQDWTAIEAEIADLKEKLHRLGHVNLDAIAELEELEIREKFLTTQRDDLSDSRRQLETLITELNEICRERFEATFEQSRIHFQELFRKLFGGGRANFILEDPTDVLESGIEIVAQPPGKELQSITLMSGGEKTMTAIALLLAIFKSKPSPFAVLDEVDAALDEANNERFNRIIAEFCDQSQFIIITHSKRTMSIADRMYGVTMQEAGVSKRVSVQFEDTSKHAGGGASAAVA